MSNFDNDFIAIDDEAIDPERPVDAWLRHRMRANNECYNQGLDPIVCAYVGGAHGPDVSGTLADDRAWCNYGGLGYPVVIPYWLSAGASGCDIDMSLKNPRLERVRIQTSIWRSPTANRIGVNDKDSTGTTQNFTSQKAPVVLSTPYQGDPRWGTLRLGVESFPDFSKPDDYLVTAVDQRVWTLDTNIFYPANNPSLAGWDTAALVTDKGDITDILGMHPATDQIFVSDAFFGPSVLPTTSFAVQTVPLSFLQCRSIALTPRYGEGPVRRTQLAAMQIETGQTAGALAGAVNSLYERRTLIAWGPAGYRPPERSETWGGSNPIRFPVVQGNPATFEESVIVNEALFWRKGAGGRMFVAMYVYPLLNGLSEPSTAEFDFVLTVGRPDNIDINWASPDTVITQTTRRNLRIFPGAPPQTGSKTYNFDTKFIKTSAWMRGRYGDTPDLSDWGYGHREGMVFEDDMANLQLVVLEVDAAAIPDLYAGNLFVQAQYVNDSVANGTGLNPGYKLTLTCVGYSVWVDKSPIT